jgi:hypothetical protein
MRGVSLRWECGSFSEDALMGMHTYVICIKPADEQWQKMKEIWDACTKAGIEPPEKVSDFFGDEAPNPKGVEINLPFSRHDLGSATNHPALSMSTDSGQEFWDVELSKLPPDVKIIRFVNSW